MPTTASGIYYPDSSTAFNPLETVFSTMASSIENILAGDVQIHRVSNTTQRNALVPQFPPTNANPLFVWRADAPNGQELEYTKNGSTWQYYSSSEDDTGWTAIAPASGFSSASAEVRTIAGITYLRGFISGSMTANNTTTIGTVPAGHRPVTSVGGSTCTTQGYSIYFFSITTAGTFTARTNQSGNNNIALGAISYPSE